MWFTSKFFWLLKTISLNPFTPKSDLIDFTLSNARWFYSSKGDPLGVKTLNINSVLVVRYFLCIATDSPWCNVLPHSTVWPYFFKIKLYLEVPGRWTPCCVQHMSSERASSHWTTEVSCAVLLNQKQSVSYRYHNIEPPSQYFNECAAWKYLF